MPRGIALASFAFVRAPRVKFQDIQSCLTLGADFGSIPVRRSSWGKARVPQLAARQSQT
jgi:hypothetical protein